MTRLPRMPRLCTACAVLACLLNAPDAHAQPIFSGGGQRIEALPVGAENSVFELEAEGPRLLVGPRLVIIEEGRPRLASGDPAFDPPTAPELEVFALDARGDHLAIGLGYVDEAADTDTPPLAAGGFAVSNDGGMTWAYRFPPLDEAADTLVTYGGSTLYAVPITQPQNSPPQGIALPPHSADVDEDVLWSANGSAGIRRSTDGGTTWQRVILPPDSLDHIHPDSSYAFPLAPFGTTLPNGAVSQFGLNYIGYSVLVDEAGTVWAGTAGGLNRSDSSDVTDSGERAWRRYSAGPTPQSLIGSLVYGIHAQPTESERDPVWIVLRRSPLDTNVREEDAGLAVWTGDDPDGGTPLFETRLLGEILYDVAFDGAAVYAAGANGLFLSENDGETWRTLRVFRDESGRPLPLTNIPPVYSVDVTQNDSGPSTLWVGTPDGLLRSTDGGASWSAFRASVPTQPGPNDDPGEVPAVDVYAYPNPYTPRVDGSVRIRLDLAEAADVRIRLYDYAMNLVRELQAGNRPAGPNEVLWDGTTNRGTRVANGTYLYLVEAGQTQASGTILVLQ